MDAISVVGLSKAYKQYPTRWSRLREWMGPKKNIKHKLNWVLKDISFTLAKGKALGVIGINGAGKSTLLKIITGTTQPTSGRVELTGKVAALLELGMGFHPEFTGRQNVYMAGQLLGFSTDEIAARMSEIEAFAEIGEYIDLPVRVYSSGMQMRLAFSVATARRPDILIVDEALSVGDAYFQHKSFDRIRRFRKEGTTLLLVSHDKQAIQSICDRAILLDAGNLIMEGEPEAVMDYYNAMLSGQSSHEVKQTLRKDGKMQTTSGTGEAVVVAASLLDEKGVVVETISVGQKVCLQIKVAIKSSIDRLVLGYGIKDRFGQIVYGTNTHFTEQPIRELQAGEECVFNICFNANLGIGTYSVQIALHSDDNHLTTNYEWRELALLFDVVNTHQPHFTGSAWIEPDIGIQRH